MSKILLFSRQPLAKRPLQDWLDDPAERIVLLTTADAVAGSEAELARHFPMHRLVEDYHGWAGERAAESVAREFGVGAVASTSEHDVLRAARLRARLGLPGQDVASATAYRDKVVMKQLVAAAGLPVPAFAPIDDPLDLLDFIDTVGFPVVVKPRLGAGAEGVGVLAEQGDVATFLARQHDADVPYLPGQWMAESFVHGDFCHVDGVMHEGKIVHGWPSAYNSGVAERVRDQAVLSSALFDPGDPRAAVLMRLTEDVVAALPPGPVPSAFHLEAWLGADDRPVFCEIASRAGGGLIAETYERAFGVHLAREHLRAQCGAQLALAGQPDRPEAAHGFVLVPPGRGTLAPPTEPCPVPGVDIVVQLAAGTTRDGLSGATDAAMSAVVRGDTRDQVTERMAELAQWWQLSSSWVVPPPS